MSSLVPLILIDPFEWSFSVLPLIAMLLVKLLLVVLMLVMAAGLIASAVILVIEFVKRHESGRRLG